MRKATFVLLLALLELHLFILTDAFCPDSSASWRRRASQVHQLSAAANDEIRFLGKASDALVKPGVVLIAPSFEFSTYLRESAVFVHAMGYDERLDADVIRCVVLDYPTAFSIGEMTETVTGSLATNHIFRGGSEGGDSVMMLHSLGLGRDEIGTSGIYEGGLQEAMEVCNAGDASPEHVKFFFNYMQFGVQEMEELLESEEDGDAWVAVDAPPEMILNSEWGRGECWAQLRNRVRQFRS